MRNPDTELDTRFSDTGAIATGWEETRRALEQAELSWISTVRAHTRQPLPRSATRTSRGEHGSEDLLGRRR